MIHTLAALTALCAILGAAPPARCLQGALIPSDIKSAYDGRFYEEVIALSESFLRENPTSPACADVRFLAGEACWELERYAAAERFLTPAVTGDARPPGWPEAALLLSRSIEKQRKFFEAAVRLSEILSDGVGERTEKDAGELLGKLVRKSLSAEELHYIAFRFRKSRRHCEVLERAAREAMEGKRWEELWDLLGLAYPECAPGDRKTWDKLAAAAAPAAPPGRCGDPYLVGLACPLEGPFAEYGLSLRRGVSLALDEYNAEARFKLGLAVRDTGGDPILAVIAARDLAATDGVVCMMGGLLSSTTIVLAAVSSALQIPLLSPSATREEIALAGPYVFQSTLPRLLQARALAGAAVSRLGAARAAVLFPETDDGKHVSGAFEKAFEDSGGEIVLSSGYLEGETNFSNVLSAAFAKAPDCLFLAGGAGDLTPLIPQLAYFNLKVPVLALESIGSGGVAELARRHLKRVLYAPDAYSLATDHLARFERSYEAAYGVMPDDFALKGYLSLGIVAQAMELGPRTRSGVARGLNRMVTGDPALAGKRFLAVTGLSGVEVPVLELISED